MMVNLKIISSICSIVFIWFWSFCSVNIQIEKTILFSLKSLDYQLFFFQIWEIIGASLI